MKKGKENKVKLVDARDDERNALSSFVSFLLQKNKLCFLRPQNVIHFLSEIFR